MITSLWTNIKSLLNAARQTINQNLKPLNLSSSKGDILFLLFSNPTLPQEQLPLLLDKGKGAISRTVSSLEEKGFITRLRQSKDKRAYTLSITKKGLEVKEQVVNVYQNLFLSATQNINLRTIEEINSLLLQVKANLETSPCFLKEDEK